jgi:hypothetical protein
MKTAAALSLLLGAAFAAAGCAAAVPEVSRPSEPPMPSVPVAQDSVAKDSIVPLRTTPAPDSVLLQVDDATIIVSMREVEDLVAQGGVMMPSLQEQYDAMRRRYQAAGWLQVGDDGFGRGMAIGLMKQGKASIRWNPTGEFLPSVRVVEESDASAGYIVYDRLFYTPDGALVLKELIMILRTGAGRLPAGSGQVADPAGGQVRLIHPGSRTVAAVPGHDDPGAKPGGG